MAEYSIYCCEPTSKIENYKLAKADNFRGWQIHHRFETHDFDGVWQKRKIHYPVSMLKSLDLYYNRPAEELIFMTRSDHMKLHNTMSYGISKRPHGKGRIPWNKGKKGVQVAWNKGKKLGGLSEEIKNKMSEAHRGKPSPNKGKHWKLIDGKRVWY